MVIKEQLELIAQARELCEKKIKELQGRLATGIGFDFGLLSEYWNEELNSWTTHLAEMDELKEEIRITEDFGIEGEAETLKHKLLTKAKRLLGVE